MLGTHSKSSFKSEYFTFSQLSACIGSKMHRPKFASVSTILALSFLFAFFIFITQDRISVHDILIPSDPVTDLLQSKRASIAELAEVLQYHYQSTSLFVDVRPRRFFNFSTISNSINLPASEAQISEDVLKTLSQASVVIVFGTERASHEPQTVASRLMNLGVKNVKIYQGGWTEWNSCKLPTSTMQDPQNAKEPRRNQ
jgi:rhodanese-related sulfurtransferase